MVMGMIDIHGYIATVHRYDDVPQVVIAELSTSMR